MSSDPFGDQAEALNMVRDALAALPLVATAELMTAPGTRGSDCTVRLTLASGTCIRADLTVIGRRSAASHGDSPASFPGTLPFDWSRPQAGQMRDALADLFPLQDQVIEMAASAGIPPAEILWEQPMRSAWRDLITAARDRGQLRRLLAAAAAADARAAAALQDLGWQETADGG